MNCVKKVACACVLCSRSNPISTFFPSNRPRNKTLFWHLVLTRSPGRAMPCHVMCITKTPLSFVCLLVLYCIVLHCIALCGRCDLWSGSQVFVVRMWHCKTTHTNEANKLEHEEEIKKKRERDKNWGCKCLVCVLLTNQGPNEWTRLLLSLSPLVETKLNCLLQ